MKLKKFKLIKEYPKSIKLNIDLIVEWEEKSLLYTTLINNRICFFTKEEIENHPKFWQEIIEQPILITEDGKELFEGDRCFLINNYEIFITTITNNFKKEPTLYFSTHESAEKWIEENRPKWSDKDMIDFLYRYSKRSKEDCILRLEEHKEVVRDDSEEETD